MNSLKKYKLQSIIQISSIIAILIIVNLLSHYIYRRFDLTQDKRYSLGEPTLKLLKSLDDVVYIKVYLDGELPAGFRRLRKSTLEMLDELKAYAGQNFEYEVLDPSESNNVEETRKIYQQLIDQGLHPVNLEVKDEGKTSQKIIFPGIIITYKNKYLPMSLLKQQIGLHPEEVLNNSIIGLEYEIINTIKRLSDKKKKKIAFIKGHGELDDKQLQDIFQTLSQFYDVENINLSNYKVGVLDNKDLIIIAKPDSTFSELEKYKIDQFVMKGGKVLWLIETLSAEMDSLDKITGVGITNEFSLNLNDMLFKYGVRINYNLVQDLQCHLIPLMTTQGTPKREFRPWIYFPIIAPNSNHPIVNNINAVWFRFVNSIDTVGGKGIKKTVLLSSSPYSRLAHHIVRINLQAVHETPDQRLFRNGNQAVAVLLEGSFTSVFKNRVAAATKNSGNYGKFLDKSVPTKMIIISDGDVIRSQISRVREQIFPLGYDRFTNQTFGNKNFILNCIDYLVDESGIMKLRSKDFKLRMMDKARIKSEKLKWQIINLALPIIFIIIFGIVFNYIRKRRFTI